MQPPIGTLKADERPARCCWAPPGWSAIPDADLVPEGIARAIVLFASLLDDRAPVDASLESLKCGWRGDTRISRRSVSPVPWPGGVGKLAQDVERQRVAAPGGRPALEKKR